MESRRIKMTKKMIQTSLLELLEQKHMSKISVSDICKHADVNRSTFYAHYPDTESVLKEIESDILEHIANISVPDNTKSEYPIMNLLIRFFDYVKENAFPFHVLLLKCNTSDFNERLVTAVMKNCLKDIFSDEDTVAKYEYVFCSSGVISSLKLWIEQSFPISSMDFAKIVISMSSRAIAFPHK